MADWGYIVKKKDNPPQCGGLTVSDRWFRFCGDDKRRLPGGDKSGLAMTRPLVGTGQMRG